MISGLPPGTYRVDAGPGTETTVTVSVASTATLDLVATSGAVEAPDAPMQEITVDFSRPRHQLATRAKPNFMAMRNDIYRQIGGAG